MSGVLEYSIHRLREVRRIDRDGVVHDLSPHSETIVSLVRPYRSRSLTLEKCLNLLGTINTSGAHRAMLGSAPPSSGPVSSSSSSGSGARLSRSECDMSRLTSCISSRGTGKTG